MTKPPRPARTAPDAIEAIRAQQVKIDQICSCGFGTPEGAEATREVLEVAARYRLGAAAALRGKARVRKFEVGANTTRRLLATLQELDEAELADLMLPTHSVRPTGSLDPEQLAAERFGQPLRMTVLGDGRSLIALLARARDGFDRGLAMTSPVAVGRPTRQDPATFLVESLHAIWLRFANGRPATEGRSLAEFAGFVAACEAIVTQAAGAPFAQSTVHNAVVVLVRRLRRDASQHG